LATNDAVPLRELRDGGGFWLPNSVIDLHLPRIKSRGLAVYCCIARSMTRQHYPGVVDLACQLRISERKVEEVIARLREDGLLNDSDLEAIYGVV